MKDHPLVFDWDEANRDHLAQHHVKPEEAEQALLGDPLDIEMQLAERGNDEERLLQIGETAKGRILQLLTTWRAGRVRVISSWDAPRQLKTYYLAEMRRRHGSTEDSEI
jgi:uncharacterized DUF497 family protein